MNPKEFFKFTTSFVPFTVDMRIFSFNLILAMDFLNKIAEFMTTGLAADVPDTVTNDDDDIKPVKSIEKSTDTVPVCF